MGVGEVVVGNPAIAVDAPKEDYRVRSTDYGARAQQTTTGRDAGLPLPPRAEPSRDYQRGYTPGLARSVRSPDPTRDRYQRPKWPKERQDGPWSRVWGGGRG